MIRLGHIDYSNCFPLHAEVLELGIPNVEIVHGTPAELNAALAAGEIDIAPASSIEYARHSDRYRVLPDFVIGSRGPIQSIILESARPIEGWGDTPRIVVPTASATSVVLLKTLLHLRFNLAPPLEWFAQESARDPIAEGADAALWIGDVALRRPFSPKRCLYDLALEWLDWTKLPFAFAVWQTTIPPERDDELEPLIASFAASRARFRAQPKQMAERYATRLGIEARRLERYWKGLSYELGPAMQEGLLHFYRLAHELGEAPSVERIAWASQKARA